MRRLTALPYLGGFLSAAWYAWFLEQQKRKYHPDITWINVTGGIALTGAWVAVRVAQGAPSGDANRGARWAWWLTVRMFVATGVPVVSWELWQELTRLRRLRAYTRGTRDVQAPSARERRGAEGSRRY